MAEWLSASDLCSHGSRQNVGSNLDWTVVLVFYHNYFSPPRSKWVPVRGELLDVFD